MNLYVGIVEDNKDPKRDGRIKARIIGLFDQIPTEDIPWSSPFKETDGKSFHVPPIGKLVSILFINDDDFYAPYYIDCENYNINLKDRLIAMNEDDYVNFTAILYDHRTQIYSDEEELKLDYCFNNIVIDKGSINLDLKNNDQHLNLGSRENSTQRALFGDNWLDWFDKFVNELIKPSSLIGNIGASIQKTKLDTILGEYLQRRKQDNFISHNVWIPYNGEIVEEKRKYETKTMLHDVNLKINKKNIIETELSEAIACNAADENNKLYGGQVSCNDMKDQIKNENKKKRNKKYVNRQENEYNNSKYVDKDSNYINTKCQIGGKFITSQNGINMIKQHEGFSSKAYWDVNGYSIGYGHHTKGVDGAIKEGMVITPDQGEEYLKQDLISREDELNRMITGDINQNQFDALMDLIYNVGGSDLRGSKLLKKVNKSPNDTDIKNRFLDFRYAKNKEGVKVENKSLIKRRTNESNLYFTPCTDEDIIEIGPVTCEDFNNGIRDDMKISKYFTIGMLTTKNSNPNNLISQKGLSREQIACNLKNLAVNVLDIIKEQYPNVIITSGFRQCDKDTSHHCFGMAADMQFKGVKRKNYYDIAVWISDNVPVYDQLLLENRTTKGIKTWIHISYKPNDINRRVAWTFYNDTVKVPPGAYYLTNLAGKYGLPANDIQV